MMYHQPVRTQYYPHGSLACPGAEITLSEAQAEQLSEQLELAVTVSFADAGAPGNDTERRLAAGMGLNELPLRSAEASEP